MPKIKLKKISTKAPKKLDKKEIREETKKLIERLDELQYLLYAQSKHSVLIVLQGMDASGKDGIVRKVFGPLNPQGIKVKSFKGPTKEELAHDYLWRVHKHTPAKGMIQIFNRSHYEEVLITRVEGWVDDKTAKKRFGHINAFEKLLADCGTTVLKFYLHISQEEQSKNFYDRIRDPRKQWKYGPEDFDKAKKWDAYENAYEDVFEHCGPDNPWMIVPCDQNWYKQYFVAKTLVETLESFDMEYPKADVDMNHPDVVAVLEQFEGEEKECKDKK